MMRRSCLALCIAGCVSAATSTFPTNFFSSVKTSHPYPSSICFTGKVPVTINAENTKFNTSQNLSQQEVTEIFQELIQVDSTYVKTHSLGPGTVNQTFNVAGQVCVPPRFDPNKGIVEVLSHGLGLSKAYWDTAPGNSFVEAANAAGFATVAYDRLGVGDSDKPDPINVIQFTVHIEILHGLVQLLRKACPSCHVVGAGHSAGSFAQLGASEKYPADFDAVIITGCSDMPQYLSNVGLSTTPSVAANDPSGAYKNLPGGYVIDPSPIGFQQAYFRYPFFSQNVFDAAYNTRSTNGVGEFITITSTFAPATSYTGPVNVVLGANDFGFCAGDCTYPQDRAQAFRTAFFPAANADKSTTFLVPDTGHLINVHNNAHLAFESSNDFVKNLGFQ